MPMQNIPEAKRDPRGVVKVELFNGFDGEDALVTLRDGTVLHIATGCDALNIFKSRAEVTKAENGTDTPHEHATFIDLSDHYPA